MPKITRPRIMVAASFLGLATALGGTVAALGGTAAAASFAATGPGRPERLTRSSRLHCGGAAVTADAAVRGGTASAGRTDPLGHGQGTA
jgi:hypothetical protein